MTEIPAPTPRNKGGRPRLGADKKRVPFTIRMEPGMIEQIKQAAAGDDASAWAREQLRFACKRALKRTEMKT